MTRKHLTTVLLGASLIATVVDPTDATSPSQARSIDLTRYYPSRDAAQAELVRVKRDAATLPKHVAAASLVPYLDRADALIARARRASAYFTILKARDIDDRSAASAIDRADAVVTQADTKVHEALRTLPGGAFDAAARRDVRLRRYAFLERQAGDRAKHDLSPDAVRAFDAIDRPAMDMFWTAYQKLDRLPVTADRADTPPPGTSPMSARETAWRKRWQASAAKAEANATLLFGIVKLNEAEARLRHYPDAVTAGYARRGLDRAMVDRSLVAVEAHLSLYRAYDDLRAVRLKRETGIAVAQPWDIGALGAIVPHFTLDDARRIAPLALAPLGKDYIAHFSALLAPASGRLDIGDDIGRRQHGGFSINAAGVPAGLFMASFKGSITDLRVVLHEGGHAVAAQYADEGGTSSFFVRGPNWQMESYALLNEFLLFDYLAQTSTSSADRIAYRNLLVDDMMFQIFGSAEEATIEQAIYDAAARGKVQSAADLDSLSLGVMRRFEPWPDDTLKVSASLWSTKELMFEDPFYLVNYLYAGVVAIELFKEAKAHPESFPARYGALLRRGYDAPPATLLAPLLGDAKDAPALMDDAFSIVAGKLAELRSLQAEIDRHSDGRAVPTPPDTASAPASAA